MYQRIRYYLIISFLVSNNSIKLWYASQKMMNKLYYYENNIKSILKIEGFGAFVNSIYFLCKQIKLIL